MRYVRYIGPSHQRMILASDWAGIGIRASTVVWNASNGFAVPADVFTDDQMSKAINADPYLMLTGDEEDFKPRSENRDMTPQELEGPRVDMTDVFDDPEPSTTDSGASHTAPGDRPAGSEPVAHARTSSKR